MLLLMVAFGGCAHRGGLARPAPETLPHGSPLRNPTIPDGDAWLRHHLMFGEYDRALTLLDGKRGATGDALWRALQRGLVLHQAGQYGKSNAAFEWAEVEADRRYTRSATRAVGSVAVSDRVLAFTPSTAELAMIPYYRMLNYIGMRDLESAAVEARKANTLLSRLERRDDARCREDAMVRYLSGLVLGAAGDRNDALVALRHAELAFRGCDGAAGVRVPDAIGADLVRVARSLGISEVADSAAERYSVTAALADGAGDLVLLVEHGFVAHRVEEALYVPIFPDDVEGLDDEDESGILEAAARITARLLNNVAERGRWGSAWDDHPAVQVAHALDGAYILRLAWAEPRRDGIAPVLRVWVNDSLAAVTPVGDLSTLAEHEMEARRAAMITRMVARGITKYVISRSAEKKTEKKHGEVAGFVMGRLINLAANELERADTRSWSLLPDGVSLVRTQLAEGEHRIRVEVLGPGGELVEMRDLGMVRVAAGELVLRNERVWSGIGHRY